MAFGWDIIAGISIPIIIYSFWLYSARQDQMRFSVSGPMQNTIAKSQDSRSSRPDLEIGE